MDRLSDMPENIIEMILECLPIYDAVRTTTLSKKWRNRWAMVSKLSLDYVFFDTMYRQHRKPPRTMYVNLVKTILIQHIGPLPKLVLYIPDLDRLNVAEINLIIRFALRNGVQELSVIKADPHPHALPSFLYSCTEQLTKLELQNCVFCPPHEFCGFPNLKSFCLNSIRSCDLDKLSSFISTCPQLRKIQLDNLNDIDQNLRIHAPRLEELSVGGCFRTIRLKEVQDLAFLYIHLVDINENIELSMACDNNMVDFITNLVKIKHIKLGGYICRLLGDYGVPRKVLKQLHCLKTIEVVEVDLGHIQEFHCLLCLIRSSPNVQQIEIAVVRDTDPVEEPYFLSDVGDYVDCCLQQLRTVRIGNLTGTKAELQIIEILLKCSPILEVMSVDFDVRMDNDAKVKVSEELMKLDRASPMVELAWTTD